jgi:hypothetical protein
MIAMLLIGMRAGENPAAAGGPQKADQAIVARSGFALQARQK